MLHLYIYFMPHHGLKNLNEVFQKFELGIYAMKKQSYTRPRDTQSTSHKKKTCIFMTTNHGKSEKKEMYIKSSCILKVDNSNVDGKK